MHYLRIIQLFIVSSLLFLGGQAFAYANTPSIDPAFNSNIIDDPLFLNRNAMSVQDIQNFLNGKVPVCDTNHQGGLAQPPYVCLKDYVDPTTNKSAAQLIYDEAQEVGINPQVILVTLQKEQSLVTDTWPYNSQYRSAMGYGCPESRTDCESAYYGFYNQVHLGARLLRAGAARSCGDTATLPAWSDIPDELKITHTTNPDAASHRVDSVATYIGSCATGSLYNYTPHRPDSAYTLRSGTYYYGNYNFVNYFTSWFGATRVAMAKSASQPQIYLTLGNRKLLIPNYDVMAAWGLTGKSISTVDQSYLDTLADDGLLTTLAKKDNGSPTIYLMDNGRQFSVPSGQACTDWGLACGDTAAVKNVSANVVESLPYAGDLPLMFSNNGIYKPEAGKKRPVLDPKTVDSLGGWGRVQPMQSLNTGQPQGAVLMLNDTAIKLSTSQAVYLFDQNQLHQFTSPEILTAWAAAGIPVVTVPDNYATGLTIGAAFAPLATDASGAQWLVDNGGRYSLSGHESDWPTGNAITFARAALSRLPIRNLKPILHSSSGSIFTVSGGNKYVFATFDDFFGLGNKLDSIGDVSQLTENLLTYGGKHLAGGRVFKIIGSDSIYVNNGTTRLQVATMQDIGFYRLPAELAISVDATTAARYPSAGALQPIFKSNDGTVYLANGQRLRLTSDIVTSYGLNTSAVPVLVDSIVSRLPLGRDLTKFIKAPNGAIYYVSGGQRHYVDSQPKLSTLGGANNVIDVPDSFINLITLGQPA